ncbi:type VI secretion system tip protein VgrG [Pseudomonas aeruginosa]|uniref:type VI secretion system Vgr family protein n=1 Tax=Pseudomonas aeruginosa TaxID=287 RepID=UPI0021F12F4C|nr:type VI secretion system tip protein VgrG [Pseudomonas aeruginosa]MCO1672400.1 type VI secretion system tip protein VgrG [Pseudomonas aeruginosa]MCO1771032.1 type VI secretion system tip protein VgrG [Pseudomonas aeruginosa]MCV4112925.1 type VI secretion system tip protein VgrG [Pseudomonas aeruginosa]MCV4246085.1 type VI secretion system tip protein VgrG [Pseudomonas aeruginosa]MCV4249916.1 type VI secretion system tip protein VgrG [Pseudomonas aeruginosa]
MPTDIHSARISLAIEGGPSDLQVLSFEGREALNQPYSFEIDWLSERPDLDLEDLLQRPAYLRFGPSEGGVHGLVDSIEQGDSGKRLTRYRITLQPRLSQLRHCRNQRIFQNLTVPQVLASVLEDHGLFPGDYRFQLGPYRYPPRDYCVQYAESDLHFLSRLCEEEGLGFFFTHSPDGHVLVFGDDQSVFPQRPPLAYRQGGGMAAEHETVSAFELRLETRSTQASRRDYDFEKPHVRLEEDYRCDFQPELEVYTYPGRFHGEARGKHLAKRSLERLRGDYELAQGASDANLNCGCLLPLSGHPRQECNDLWLVREVLHEGRQPQVLEESADSAAMADDGFRQGYRNRFLATPWDIAYRPSLEHPKSKLLGHQTAVVSGPAGEEIHCDEYGRIQVRFHWDRNDTAGRTSCWLRVASNWAGDRQGGVAIPRVGMEVLVSFLEGDPDQPLVTGCLYHRENLVPYELPAHRTRSLFKSLSSPAGGGYNELRIDDRAGSEQIYLHAQRDWDENIEHDQKIRIGHERHDTVEANSYSEFHAEEQRIGHAGRKVEVRAGDHLTVAGERHLRVGVGHFVETGEELHYHAGDTLVIDAGMELTAKAGGSFLKLDPGGVTHSGPSVALNSGGAPGMGSGARPILPGQALPAAAEQPGDPLLAAQKNALRRAARLAQPVCEICRKLENTQWTS